MIEGCKQGGKWVLPYCGAFYLRQWAPLTKSIRFFECVRIVIQLKDCAISPDLAYFILSRTNANKTCSNKCIPNWCDNAVSHIQTHIYALRYVRIIKTRIHMENLLKFENLTLQAAMGRPIDLIIFWSRYLNWMHCRLREQYNFCVALLAMATIACECTVPIWADYCLKLSVIGRWPSAYCVIRIINIIFILIWWILGIANVYCFHPLLLGPPCWNLLEGRRKCAL